MIRIGITGHRFLSDVEKLRAGIDEVLARIEQNNPGQDWSVISALAEGADRLVLERIWEYKPTAKLIVPLPLPVEEYQDGFTGDPSRQEFSHWLNLAVEVIRLQKPSVPEEGYLAAGLYVLDHCDLLIALWDGRKAQGQGGTGEIVSLAQRRRIPLAWVYSQRQNQERINHFHSSQEPGTVSYERLDG
jgi:hypothetical protein